jgi:hypothetical protein
MMPATTVGAALRPLVTRVLGLAAICAIAVSAGCGSPSLPTSTNTPARQLTGSMDDWGAAVCKYGRYRQYSLIPVPTWMCSGNPGGGGFTTLLFIFEFRDQSEMRAHPEDWGHRYSYASCTSDDGRITVFVSDVSGIGSKGEAAQLTNESIQPLTRFGCTITQNDPYQSPSTPEQIPQPQPPPQPLPGSTNAMPPPTGMPPPPGNVGQFPPDADAQGWLQYPEARCDYTNPAVAMGRTSDSALVICQMGVGRYYYKGYGFANQLGVEIDDPVPTGSGFVATHNGFQYSVSRAGLIIAQGATVISDETMLEYWSD